MFTIITFLRKKGLHHCLVQAAKPVNNRTNTSNKHPSLRELTQCAHTLDQYRTLSTLSPSSVMLCSWQPLNSLLHTALNCPWTSITKPPHPGVTERTAPPWLYIPEDKQTTPPLDPFAPDSHACGWDVHRFSPYPCVCRTTAYSFGTQTWERAWRKCEGWGAHGLWLVTLKKEVKGGCW